MKCAGCGSSENLKRHTERDGAITRIKVLCSDCSNPQPQLTTSGIDLFKLLISGLSAAIMLETHVNRQTLSPKTRDLMEKYKIDLNGSRKRVRNRKRRLRRKQRKLTPRS